MDLLAALQQVSLKDGATTKELVQLISPDSKVSKDQVSTVNSALYKMLSAKTVTREIPEGTLAPRWKLAAPVDAKSNDSKLNTKILEILHKSATALEPLKIAKAAMGSAAKTSQINPLLYKLASAGKIKKTCNADGTKPLWSIVVAPDSKVSAAAADSKASAAAADSKASAAEPVKPSVNASAPAPITPGGASEAIKPAVNNAVESLTSAVSNLGF